jgi:hypothetical protein
MEEGRKKEMIFPGFGEVISGHNSNAISNLMNFQFLLSFPLSLPEGDLTDIVLRFLARRD